MPPPAPPTQQSHLLLSLLLLLLLVETRPLPKIAKFAAAGDAPLGCSNESSANIWWLAPLSVGLLLAVRTS